MKRTLVLAMIMMLTVSPVAAQESGGSGQDLGQRFGAFVSGIAGAFNNVGSTVVNRLSETIRAGQASEALNNAVSRFGNGQPDNPQDQVATSNEERNEEKGIIPEKVVKGLVS